MASADFIIVPEWLVPVEPAVEALEGQAVAVADGRVVETGPADDVFARYPGVERIVREDHALMPGLVNAHTHGAMTLLRGLADDLPLDEWLRDHIWPAETEWVGSEFVRAGTELAVVEMLDGGITTFNDMYFFPDVVGEVCARAGMRVVVGMIVIEFPTAWAENADQYINRGLEVHDRFKGHALVSTAFAPHAPYTVNDETLSRIRLLADELECPVHMHIHETSHEIDESVRAHGSRPLARLDRLGLVNTLLAGVHATQLQPEEIELLAERGASIVHCPESNMKLASGSCPVTELRAAGVDVAIGTDGAASNNDLDMLAEMRSAALLGKHIAGDAGALAADTVISMATISAARTLGLDADIGSLAPGKAADMITIDLSGPHCRPVFDPVSQIVYSAKSTDVRDVWVNGRPLKYDGELNGIDIPEVLSRADAWRERLLPHG